MRSFLIAGGILLAISIVLGFLGWWTSRRVGAISGAETTSCAAVKARCDTSGETVVELVGRAVPGDGGPLTAPFTRHQCVWHRTKVTRRYWEWTTSQGSDGKTRKRRVERNDVVFDRTSDAPFGLRDDSGSVAVDPAGANVDRPTQVRNRFERDTGSLLLDLGLQAVGRGNTIGFRREEWIIEPSQRLYVLGAAIPGTGAEEATIVKPRSGFRELLISTRSERDLLRASRWKTRLFYAGAVLAAAASVAVIIVGLSR